MIDINIIPSKSDAHRAIICSGLSEEPCNIEIAATSKDIEATRACMREIRRFIEGLEGLESNEALDDLEGLENLEDLRGLEGLKCDEDLEGREGHDVHEGGDSRYMDMRCGESGSTLRFLLPVVCAVGVPSRFWPEGRLSERPLSPLYEELIAHGAEISPQGTVPLEVKGRIHSGHYVLPGNVSSQYISGLLMALPLLDGDSEIVVQGKYESRGYVNMTLRTLRKFGIEVEEVDVDGIEATETSTGRTAETIYRIPGNQTYLCRNYEVEGDWSNAAFWLVLGALGDEEIRVHGLDMDSAQGDKKIVALLREFGADIEVGCDAVIAKPSRDKLHGIEIDASQIPDMVPALALVAALAQGETRIINAGRLRIKESDRLASVAEVMRAFGAEVTEGTDSLTIVGTESLKPADIDGHNDHRIVMMAAVAGIIAGGSTTIHGAKAVEKSYPGFFRELETRGLGESLVQE